MSWLDLAINMQH